MATLGIAIGVGALVLALAALAGLQDALRTEVLERTPHLEIELAGDTDRTAIRQSLEALDGVVETQEVLRGRGWVRSGGLVQPVEIVGYSGALPTFFPGPAAGARGFYVGDAIAERWGLQAGDPLEVISPRPTLGPLGPQPRVRSLRLTGTFAMGRTEEVERLALPLEIAATLTARTTPNLVVQTDGLEQAIALLPRIEQVLPAGSRVATWRELNRPLFFALRLEKTVMFVAVSLILIVASLALVADLALLIANKRREVGMLGAMGTRPPQMRRAFLVLGGLLSGVGALAGGLVGGGLAWSLDRWRWVHLPDHVYFLDYLPFRVETTDLAMVIGLTMFLAWGSAYFVAQRVGQIPTVEALRR